MGDGHEEIASRRVRLRSALFPVPHCRQFKTKLQSELLLRHLQHFADSFDIYFGRRAVDLCDDIARSHFACECRNAFDRRQFDHGVAVIEKARDDRVSVAHREMPLCQGQSGLRTLYLARFTLQEKFSARTGGDAGYVPDPHPWSGQILQ